MRPSYAQMAQKPRISSAPKSPTEASNGKEAARKGTTKQEEEEKPVKNNHQKPNNEDKENLKKDNDVSDKSGLVAKTQKQPRDSRIVSDSGSRNNQKPTNVSNRSNSYSGQPTASVKESYASKSSANHNSQAATAWQNTGNSTHTQHKNSKGSAHKAGYNAGKPQKRTEAESCAEGVHDDSEETGAMNAEQNDDKEEQGDHFEGN